MNVLKAFCSLASLTFVSRVTGFLKVAAFAAFYGRSSEADMFLAVMILPDLLYRFLSEGLVSSASVPLFVELREDKKKLVRAIVTISWIAFLFSAAIAIIFSVFSAELCSFFTPGFTVTNLSRMRQLWSITTLYLVAGVLAGVFTSLLNAYGYFALPAVGPLLVNLSTIIGIFVARGGPVEIITYAVVLGSVAQLLWLLFLVKRYDFSLTIKNFYSDFDSGIASSFIRSVFPVAAWISVLPFIPVYERYLLSMQPTGSVAALNYIEKLFNLPLGILSISLARAILPELSRLHGVNRNRFLFRMLMISTIVITPVVIISFVFSEQIVEIVFKRGRFSLDDAIVAARLFRCYSFALLPTTLCMLLNRGFFASKNYFVPFLAGLIAAIVQFYTGRPFVEHFGAGGIGYAAAVAFSAQLVILLVAELWFSASEKPGSAVKPN
ncbi:MAG: murein biosynthesis integral membrane protein MurJ [Candidatus Rifleibacteriota bacterium]